MPVSLHTVVCQPPEDGQSQVSSEADKTFILKDMTKPY